MNLPLVLVVDDNVDHRLIISACLEESAFAVAQAATAEDALAIMDREHPDLVILDMILPRSGGRDLARLIKSRYPDVPIVAISASTSALPSLAEGDFVAALAKPFDHDELIDLVRGLYPRRWPSSPIPLDEPIWLPNETVMGRQGNIALQSMVDGFAVR